MCYLVLRLLRFLFRFLPPDEEEIINLLNKKRIDPDFSVQTIEKHTAECVMYGFHSTYGPRHKVEGQQLANIDFRNHVAENIRQEYDQVAAHNMTYKYRNHVAESKCSSSREELQLLPSHHLAFDSRNHVAEKDENKFLEVECQLLNHYFTLDIRNHVAENTQEESQLLPSHNLVL